MLVARSPRSGSGAVGAAIINSEGAIIAVGQNRLLDLPGAPRRGQPVTKRTAGTGHDRHLCAHGVNRRSSVAAS
jgi:deoxycytidylate deaminase